VINVAKQVFPDGLYNLDDGPMVDGLAAESTSPTAADAAVSALRPEVLPNTASDLLGDWEAEMGISPPPGGTEAERQAFAAAWYGMDADLSIDHIQWLASLILGYEPAIRENTIVTVGDHNYGVVGEARIGDVEWGRTTHLDIDPGQTDINTYDRTRLDRVAEGAVTAGIRLYVGFTGPFKVGIHQVNKDKLS